LKLEYQTFVTFNQENPVRSYDS